MISTGLWARKEDESDMNEQNSQIRELESRLRRQGVWLKLGFVAWIATLGAILMPNYNWHADAQKADIPSSLRVSELVVVDPKGVERVRIGGDIPDAVINGKKANRGEKVAGVMLYDGTGQERGGYVTFEPSGNVGLTLDTKKEQVALLAAGPDEGSVIKLWNRNDLIEFRSDEEGTRLTTVKGGKVLIQEPPIKLSPEACKEYSNVIGKLTRPQVVGECQKRYSSAACKTCLGTK